MAGERDIADDLTLAEAVAWLTTLQDSDQRTPAAESAFREWMQADAGHARAFAHVTEVWDALPGALSPVGASARSPQSQPPQPQPRRRYAMAASIAMVLSVAGAWAWYARDPVYETDVGQQETVSLSDGTRVALNTDSRLAVDFSDAERRVRLDRGEVLFDVAKNPDRPFVVEAGNERIRAVGTSFVVRRDGERVSVTLLKGRVLVSHLGQGAAGAALRPAMLTPGERLIVDPARVQPAQAVAVPPASLAIDRPKLDSVTAWREGNVMFDDTPLAEAMQEINRYGGKPLQLSDPRLGSLRISGVFSVQDPVQFAQLAAELHNLKVVQSADGIEMRDR